MLVWLLRGLNLIKFLFFLFQSNITNINQSQHHNTFSEFIQQAKPNYYLAINDIIIIQQMNPLAPPNLNEVLKKGISLQNFKTLQFLAQFLIFSKYGEESPIFQQFLIATQMVKFILKLTEYYKSYRNPKSPTNIYLQKYQREGGEQKQKEPIPHKKVQRIKLFLDRIKNAQWTKKDFQPQLFQHFPNGKKVQLVTSVPIPKQLQRSRLKFWQVLGELLFIIRPLIAILAIRVFGQQSYIPYFISLFIERKVKLLDQVEMMEWQSRQKDLLWRCLFKRPFFQIFKNKIIKPALGVVMAEHRLLYRIIMYIVEIQSSITLTI